MIFNSLPKRVSGKNINPIAAIAAMIILSTTVSGFEIWTEPISPDIKNVLVNSKTAYDINIMTDAEHDVKLDFSIAGPIKDWVIVRPETVTISKSEQDVIRLILEPKDIPTGRYTSQMIMTSISEVPATTTIAESYAIPLSVQVTDNEIIAAEIEDIEILDMFEGEKFSLKGYLHNTGNTLLQPTISVEIMNSDRSSVITMFEKQENILMAGEMRLTEINESSGLGVGEYFVKVDLKADDVIFKRQFIKFNVVEASESKGMLQDVQATALVAGNQRIVNISGNFMNRGDESMRARLVAAVYQDNVIIERVIGEEQEVSPGSYKEISAVFRPRKSGEYTIESFAEHNGRHTAGRTSHIEIKEDSFVELGTAGLIIFALFILVITLRALLNRKKELKKNKIDKDDYI